MSILLSIALLSYLIKYLTLYETDFIISLIASLIAGLGLSLLLFLEHQRSFKASDLATLYLILSIICDVILLTMPSKLAAHIVVLHPVLVRCSMHLALLVLEFRSKHQAFGDVNNSQSPEELNGVVSRVFFTWINPILLQGYKNILIDQDLPPLSHDLKAKVTRKAILQTWNQRG